MKNLKKKTFLLITALLIVTAAIIWIATARHPNKTEAFLTRYEITDLTALGFTFVVAINDKGQVLGRDKQNPICIWDKQNGLTVLNVPTNHLVDAFNNSGQIAGGFQPANGVVHAFIWDANNGLVDLGTLGGRTSQVSAMNDLGQVIGLSRDPKGQWHSFFWDTDTGMLNLSASTNDPNRSFRALGINNAATVVGYTVDGRGFTASAWHSDKGLIRLAIPPGSKSMASRISHNGKIAGWSVAKDNYCHLIIWDDPNNYRDLGRISKDGFPFISSINDAGQIIGVVGRRTMFDRRSIVFFFSDERGFVDIGDLPRYDPTPSRWRLPWLLGSTSTPLPCEPEMNNRGQILYYDETKDAQYHALLMTPKKDSEE